MTETRGSQIIKRLDEEERKEGSLPPVLQFYRHLLVIQSETGQRLGTPDFRLSDTVIKERFGQGIPLLSFDDIELDWALFIETFAKIKDLFVDYPELFVEMPGNIANSGSLSRDMVRAYFEEPGLSSMASDDRAPKDALAGMVQLALTPFLERYAEVLVKRIDQERWRRRYCPVCGGAPDFAYLDKSSGARWLLCSRCNAEWLFQRLECPYCGCTEQDKLAYFTDEGGLYRLYVCESCHRYIKAIDLRLSKSEVLLPLERLLSLDMDAQAREYGYTV